MPPSAPNSTAIVHSIVTVTQNASTTTIFITTPLPPTTPSPRSSSSSSSSTGGGPNASRQKAVIAGSAVGGFVGFSLILGLLLWAFYFRRGQHKQNHGSGDDQPTTYQAGRRGRLRGEMSAAASSLSGLHFPAPALQPDGNGGEKEPDRRSTEPLQPPFSPQLPEEAGSVTYPVRQRTITSTSESGPHPIPVVVPSFAYRESAGSGSSGSRIVNALKRTSAVGVTANSSSSRRRMSEAPYQYGVVGSADARRGLESGSSHLVPIHHDSAELEGWRAEALYGSASSPNRVPLALPASHSRLREYPSSHRPHLSVSSGSGGGAMSGSGSGHSADSHHTPILAAAASFSYHEPDRPLPHTNPSIALPLNPRPHLARLQRPSSPLDEHIVLSNYISSPSVGSSSSSRSGGPGGGKKPSWKTRRKRRSATVSDSGHGGGESSANVGSPSISNPTTLNLQRSLSLDMTFLGNSTPRAKHGSDTSQHSQSPLSAGPPQSLPVRQAPPPSSFLPHAQLSSFPSPADAQTTSSGAPAATTLASAAVPNGDTSDENEREYSSSTSAEVRRQRRPKRSRSRDGCKRRTISGEAPLGGKVDFNDPSIFYAPPAGRRASNAGGGSGYTISSAAEYKDSQDKELARLARVARRAERKIRRESRGTSDPGHGYRQDPQDQNHSGRRTSRPGTNSRTRRYSGSGADFGTGTSTSPRRLVLRNV